MLPPLPPDRSKVAITDLFESIVTLVALPVPDASPLQPTNVEPLSGTAVKVTTAPLVYLGGGPGCLGAGVVSTVPVPVFVMFSVKQP